MNLKWIIFCWILFGLGCSKPKEKDCSNTPKDLIDLIEIPTDTIEVSKLKYHTQTSTYTLNGKDYSGYATSRYPNGALKKLLGISNGKKQNQVKDWYANGQLKQLANYHQGKLHGEKKSWLADSAPILIDHLHYHLGKLNGEQKKWYPTGELYKVLQMDMGKEEGIQQAFRKNGTLYANYEARAGRIFGLKRAALCYDLENEIVQYEK